MSRLVLGHDIAVAEWVARRLPHIGRAENFGSCTAIGFAIGAELVGGVVFNHYSGHDVQLTIATLDPRWCTRGNLRAVFHYSFIQLGCARNTAVTARSNKRARALLERLGFIHEGTHPRGFDGRQTALSYGLLRES